MPWEGKPLWHGEYQECRPIVGKLFPVVMGQPFCIQIEGSDDFFFMLFSTEEKLRDTVDKFIAKMEKESGLKHPPYVVEPVLNECVLDVFSKMGVRIMFDPFVVDEHHTKWGEIVKEGDKYKYLDPRLN